MSDVNGEWFGVQGGADVETYTQSNGYEVLSWGSPYTGHSSKYGFDGVDGPVSIEDSDPFMLGTFAHQNNPIPEGSAIEGTSLRISTEFSASGDSSGTQSAVSVSYTHITLPTSEPSDDYAVAGTSEHKTEA